ncbi:MAG: histidine phosphatase family protein [Pseudomonadota bacterium]
MIEFPQRRRIYLLRHGEAAYVSADGVVTTDPRNVPLTTTGEAQARTQGQALSQVQFDKAICSGLPRTVQTATLVLGENKHARPELTRMPSLEEIQGLKGGRQWPPPDGRSTQEVLREIANPWATGAEPGARFLEGDLFADFAARVRTGWQQIIADPDWSTLLLVLHGAVNRMIFNLVLDINWRADLCIEQDNCNINIIDVDVTEPPRFLIRAINLTAYNLSKEGIVLTNMEDTARRISSMLEPDNE